MPEKPIGTPDTAMKPIEDTAWELSINIANHEDTYKLLMEFAHKILIIAGVKII